MLTFIPSSDNLHHSENSVIVLGRWGGGGEKGEYTNGIINKWTISTVSTGIEYHTCMCVDQAISITHIDKVQN